MGLLFFYVQCVQIVDTKRKNQSPVSRTTFNWSFRFRIPNTVTNQSTMGRKN